MTDAEHLARVEFAEDIAGRLVAFVGTQRVPVSCDTSTLLMGLIGGLCAICVAADAKRSGVLLLLNQLWDEIEGKSDDRQSA